MPDPDIIMIERCDFDTAHIAIQSSLTGHLVLDAAHQRFDKRQTRLTDMGSNRTCF